MTTQTHAVVKYVLDDFEFGHKMGQDAWATVTLKVTVDGIEHTLTSRYEAVGIVNAVFGAIDMVFKLPVGLKSYQIHNTQPGPDSTAAVFVMITKDEYGYESWGRASDVVEASALAYIGALNQIKAGLPGKKLKSK